MLGARGIFSALQETVGPAKGLVGPPPAMEAQLRRWGAQAEAGCRSCHGEGGGWSGSSPRDGRRLGGWTCGSTREPQGMTGWRWGRLQQDRDRSQRCWGWHLQATGGDGVAVMPGWVPQVLGLANQVQHKVTAGQVSPGVPAVQ